MTKYNNEFLYKPYDTKYTFLLFIYNVNQFRLKGLNSHCTLTKIPGVLFFPSLQPNRFFFLLSLGTREAYLTTITNRWFY